MHELSIALSMIDGVLEESQKRGGLRVDAVHLRIGELSGVDKEALTFSYGLACEGTPLQGSRLVIENVPVFIRCPICGKERQPPSLQELYCPDCRTPAQDIIRGREIELAALEVAD